MTYPYYRVICPKPELMTSVRGSISKEKLHGIQNSIKKLITNQTTNNLNKLLDEGALISRMCCKVKKKFRGEKLFRRLKQITVSIRKLYQINISEVISILLSTFENGMPNKEAGLWAGSRILAATNLIDQLYKFSEGVARLIVKVFQNGQCWLEMNIALAMVSRVWILAKSLHRSFLRSYNHCRSLVDQLKMANIEWPLNFELPENPHDDLLENSQSESEEELVARPGSVMRRKPEPENEVVRKRKRPGKLIRLLQEKHENKIKVVKRRKCF